MVIYPCKNDEKLYKYIPVYYYNCNIWESYYGNTAQYITDENTELDKKAVFLLSEEEI